MTLMIEISNELEARIETEARRSGSTKTDFILGLLEDRFQTNLALESSNSNGQSFSQSRVIAKNLPITDRSRELAWLEEHRNEYDGKYVALSGNCLIAAGESYKEVAAKARESGVENALLVHVEGSETPPSVGGIW